MKQMTNDILNNFNQERNLIESNRLKLIVKNPIKYKQSKHDRELNWRQEDEMNKLRDKSITQFNKATKNRNFEYAPYD